MTTAATSPPDPSQLHQGSLQQGSAPAAGGTISDEEADKIVDKILAEAHLTVAGHYRSWWQSIEYDAELLAEVAEYGIVGATGHDLWAHRETLHKVDDGRLVPDRESRLGAYAATMHYPKGTVGDAVHQAIGFIYEVFGAYGEERIGVVFNSQEAKALFPDPARSPSGYDMAAIEYAYWRRVLHSDPSSGGGMLGSSFPPTVRDWLQRYVFGASGQ